MQHCFALLTMPGNENTVKGVIDEAAVFIDDCCFVISMVTSLKISNSR